MNADTHIPRAQRFFSHTIVTIKRYKHVPFFGHSGVLLDISTQGFKLEFVAKTTSNIGECYWLSVPLHPLKIASPSNLVIKAQCKWFDPQRLRMGGVFLDLENSQKEIIETIIERLKD